VCRYPWGSLREGNSKELFIRAYRHVVRVLRGTGGSFRFQLAYAVRNANDDQTPLKEFYPG
jgi:hypothetical protein